jgi:MFS family permease
MHADDNPADAGQDPARAVGSWPFRWYVAAQGISVAGTTMGYTAIYWLTIHLAHGDALVLSTLVAAQFLPVLLFSRRAGTIVARYRASRVLVVTQLAGAAGALALAIPLLAGWMAVWYLWLVGFAVGWLWTVDVTARQMFMLDLVGPAELRRGSALYSTCTGLAKIVGPAAAGVIIAATGEALVFVADAVSFLAVLVVLAWLPGAVPHVGGPAVRAAGRETARRFRWVLDLPRGTQAAVLMAGLIGGFGLQFAVVNPLMADEVFHLSSVGFSLIGSATAVGGIAGSYYSSRHRDSSGSDFLLWSAVFGAAELAAGVMPAAWAYDLAMAAVGAATALFATSAAVYAQQATPERQRAHAVSAYNAGFMGFVPAGTFAIAGLVTLAGTRWALIVPGVAILACATTARGTVRRTRRVLPSAGAD